MRSKLAAALLPLTAVAVQGQAPTAPVDIPVPIGQSVIDIRVPHFNREGKMSLRLNASRAERSSKKDFTFDRMRVEVFDEKAGEDPTLELVLQEAVFDQTTSKLTSNHRSVISGDNIKITGGGIEFDVHQRTSRLQGPVTMTLSDPINPR
jgi:hypothetical protein